MDITMIVLNAIFFSNIISYLGCGIIGLQSDKKNFLYLLVSCASTIIGVILGEMLIYLVLNNILIPLKFEFLKMFVIILVALIMAYLSRIIIKYTSKESFYLFERSYQFAAQTVLMVGIMIVTDLSQTFLNSLYIVAAYCAGYLLVQLLMYALYDKIDSRNNFKPARNVPVLLYTLSIIGIILTSISMLF